MTGKEVLNNCPQEVKSIIIDHFGSLDEFYAYAYKLNANQYRVFKQTKQFDDTQINRLKDFLEEEGIDFMLVDNILKEIGNDFTEVVMVDHMKNMLGDNWQKRIVTFNEMIGLQF